MAKSHITSYNVCYTKLLRKTASNTGTNYSLDVNGSIRANEVVVNTTGADFVFADDYKLMDINALNQFVTTNKHLPGVAPALEMQENGVNLSELNTKLLQKVEELTLYLIQQKKELDAMKTEIELLKGR